MLHETCDCHFAIKMPWRDALLWVTCLLSKNSWRWTWQNHTNSSANITMTLPLRSLKRSILHRFVRMRHGMACLPNYILLLIVLIGRMPLHQTDTHTHSLTPTVHARYEWCVGLIIPCCADLRVHLWHTSSRCVSFGSDRTQRLRIPIVTSVFTCLLHYTSWDDCHTLRSKFCFVFQRKKRKTKQTTQSIHATHLVEMYSRMRLCRILATSAAIDHDSK